MKNEVFKKIDLDKIIDSHEEKPNRFLSDRERRLRQFGLTPKTHTKKRKKKKK
jgi:hypothetical protein